MGQNSSKLSNKDIQKLVLSTHYSGQEIRQIYKLFKTDNPTGINEDLFCSLIKSLVPPSGDWQLYSHLLFAAVDQDHDGRIGFEDYIAFKSIEKRGTVQERIHWYFRFLDVDHDGEINRKDMQLAISATQAAKCEIAKYPLPVDETINKLFEIMDTDKKNTISLREFEAGYLQDFSGVDALLFGPINRKHF